MRSVARNSSEPGEVVLLTGPAAAGKTSVAKILAETSSEPSVHLHADDFFHSLKVGRLRSWEPGANAQHEVVYEAVGTSAAVYAAGGYLVVLDSLVRHQFFEILLEPIRRQAIPIHLVILRPSFEVVLARSDGRDAGQRHQREILLRLFGYFANLGDLERYAVNNSTLDPGATARLIRERISEGHARL